jgi:MSHA biogenesis protein MshK
MSLVNDALRRAQDAQKKGQPAAPGPQLRPAEPVAEKRGMGIWVPVVIAVVAVAGLILVWQNRQKAEARQPLAEPKPAAPVATIPETKPPVQPAVAPTPAPAAPVVAPETPVPAPVVSAPAPQLKLQAIFYSPGHSSAMISGKTVRVGDNFRGFRVAALTQTSATLVSATQTNVMTLEQE